MKKIPSFLTSSPYIKQIEAENLRLRECLEFYENEDNWNGKNKTAHWDSMNCALEDHGNRAREALKKLRSDEEES